MSLRTAQFRAWNLSRTLMVCIVLFRIDGRQFGVTEACEYDGDPEAIVRTYDPFE
ncbi:hypothetical protein BH10PSE14_BH10PSE14_29140 [soil metagenome]